MADESAPFFARTAESDPRGKLDERLDIPVPSAVKEDCVFISRLHGFKTVSEWARHIIYNQLYGSVDQAQRLCRSAVPGDGVNRG